MAVAMYLENLTQPAGSAGYRVLVMTDCDSAIRMMEEAWRGENRHMLRGKSRGGDIRGDMHVWK